MRRKPNRAETFMLKTARGGFVEGSRILDSFAVPGARRAQDEASRRSLRIANNINQLLGKKRQAYVRINQQGQREIVK